MNDNTAPRGILPPGTPYAVALDGALWGVVWADSPMKAADQACACWLLETGRRPYSVAVAPHLPAMPAQAGE